MQNTTEKIENSEKIELPWVKFFGELDYDPCANIRRPENIPDKIFYKACYMASHYESWFDEPDSKELDAAWTEISALNATGRRGEGLFDLG
jgi:hypothetical protein